jgi:hypothetical protein
MIAFMPAGLAIGKPRLRAKNLRPVLIVILATRAQFFSSETIPLTHRAAIRANASMSKGIVEETVCVFLLRCEKCNRPIISWMLSPRHGGYSLEKAQTKSLPLTCVMKECGWSEARFRRDAIESWAVPGHMQPLGRLINREKGLNGVRALVFRAVFSFSKCFPWHLAGL